MDKLEELFEALLKQIHALREPIENALHKARKQGYEDGYRIGHENGYDSACREGHVHKN